VKGYLLKPLRAQDLLDALGPILAQHETSQQEISRIEANNEELLRAKAKMHQLFLERAAGGRVGLPAEIAQLNSEYLLGLMPGRFLMAILKLDHKKPDFVFPDHLTRQVEEATLEALTPITNTALCLTAGKKTIVFLNYPEEARADIEKAFQQIVDAVMLQAEKFEQIRFTACLGTEQQDPGQIAASYQDAYRALQQRIAAKQSGVVPAPPAYDAAAAVAAHFSEGQKAKLAQDIDQGNLDELAPDALQVFAGAEAEGGYPPAFWWEAYLSLYGYVLKLIQPLGVATDEELALGALRLKLEDAQSAPMLRAAFEDALRKTLDQQKEAFATPENLAVSIAKKYIAAHYQDRITLSDIAGIVYLNPVYFSILFKRECGMNFVDYVNRYRIDMSKALLKDVKRSMAEIAKACGFSSTKYYSKIFKKTTGLTPSEYRIRHHR